MSTQPAAWTNSTSATRAARSNQYRKVRHCFSTISQEGTSKPFRWSEGFPSFFYGQYFSNRHFSNRYLSSRYLMNRHFTDLYLTAGHTSGHTSYMRAFATPSIFFAERYFRAPGLHRSIHTALAPYISPMLRPHRPLFGLLWAVWQRPGTAAPSRSVSRSTWPA